MLDLVLFSLNRAPQLFYSIGAHGDRLSSPSGDLGDTISRQLVNSPSGPPSSSGFILNRKKSELDLTQDLQFLGIRLRLDLGEASLPESKAWEIPEASLTSFSLIRSDRPVYATGSIRPSGPCQPSSVMAGPTFSTQGWGAHMGDSQISGTWTRTDRKLHINCLELKAVISALQHWAPVLQGH